MKLTEGNAKKRDFRHWSDSGREWREVIVEAAVSDKYIHRDSGKVIHESIYPHGSISVSYTHLMLDGKKGVAQKIVYGAFDRIAEETGKDALEVFTEAMNNIMPALEVKARRIGGATYQVPIDVRPDRRQALALRWITLYSRKRSEKTMEERLAKELMDAANNTGASVTVSYTHLMQQKIIKMQKVTLLLKLTA